MSTGTCLDLEAEESLMFGRIIRQDYDQFKISGNRSEFYVFVASLNTMGLTCLCVWCLESQD